jgi:hypothetical protein
MPAAKDFQPHRFDTRETPSNRKFAFRTRFTVP